MIFFLCGGGTLAWDTGTLWGGGGGGEARAPRPPRSYAPVMTVMWIKVVYTQCIRPFIEDLYNHHNSYHAVTAQWIGHWIIMNFPVRFNVWLYLSKASWSSFSSPSKRTYSCQSLGFLFTRSSGYYFKSHKIGLVNSRFFFLIFSAGNHQKTPSDLLAIVLNDIL